MKKIIWFMNVFIMMILMTFIFSHQISYASTTDVAYGVEASISGDYGIAFASLPFSEKKVKVQIDIYEVHIYDKDNHEVNTSLSVQFDDDESWDTSVHHVSNGGKLCYTSYGDENSDSLRFETDSSYHFTLKLKITKLTNARLTISCPKSITIKENGSKTINPSIYYGDELIFNEDASIKLTSSNKKIATVSNIDWDMDGKFDIEGNEKPGKCKIKVVVKYMGVQCQTTIKVKTTSALKPGLTAFGELESYSTRDNIFTMYIKNNSQKSIVIYSKDAVALDYDYKSFDRNIRLTGGRSSIVIKPRETKTIKWKVIGSTTWYDVEDFVIYAKCGYKGKKKWISVSFSRLRVLKNAKA